MNMEWERIIEIKNGAYKNPTIKIQKMEITYRFDTTPETEIIIDLYNSSGIIIKTIYYE
ncbi:MAG: hypothetical protein BroJett020_02040 [Bacteroidota bacterium]|nr:MAG: hypothetical protein BroJett020_02040 [Bacteroidota bacterium]